MVLLAKGTILEWGDHFSFAAFKWLLNFWTISHYFQPWMTESQFQVMVLAQLCIDSAQLWFSHWSDLMSDRSPALDHRKLHLRDTLPSTPYETLERRALENQLSPVEALLALRRPSLFRRRRTTSDLPLVTKICNAMHQLQILASKNHLVNK